MKNIHVLPTDKPSRLQKFINYVVDKIEFELCSKDEFFNKGQHIYITNDEEIKEGDWYIDIKTHTLNKACQDSVYFANNTLYGNVKSYEKIILTTDQDLIKDGVQAITDDFLEWFVKNPSCESVDVNDWIDTNGNIAFGGNIRYQISCSTYKEITIPQEEPKPVWKQIIEDCGGEEAFMEDAGLKPKQDRTCSNNCSVVCGECQILEHKQEPCDNCNNDVCCCTIKKQETLEKVAHKMLINYGIKSMGQSIGVLEVKKLMVNFAKWQQEQDKNMYSEKEVLDLIYKRDLYLFNIDEEIDLELPEEWFEQFKKK